MFRAAGLEVVATVRSQPMAQPPDVLLGPVATTPVYGAFVSLKRGGQVAFVLRFPRPDGAALGSGRPRGNSRGQG